jgi:hypothetical protein
LVYFVAFNVFCGHSMYFAIWYILWSLKNLATLSPIKLGNRQ